MRTAQKQQSNYPFFHTGKVLKIIYTHATGRWNYCFDYILILFYYIEL